MYTRREFLEDAALAGRVLYAQQGPTCIFSSRGCLPALDPKNYSCFTDELFAYIEMSAPKRLFRFFGGAAVQNGGWWSAHYPYQEIHADLPSWYAPSSREGLAVKHTWSTMSELIEAVWPRGSTLFYGRAAPQSENARILGGGNLQYYCQGPWPAGLKVKSVQVRG